MVFKPTQKMTEMLKQERATGTTLQDLSDSTGLSKATISNVCNGKTAYNGTISSVRRR